MQHVLSENIFRHIVVKLGKRLIKTGMCVNCSFGRRKGLAACVCRNLETRQVIPVIQDNVYELLYY